MFSASLPVLFPVRGLAWFFMAVCFALSGLLFLAAALTAYPYNLIILIVALLFGAYTLMCQRMYVRQSRLVFPAQQVEPPQVKWHKHSAKARIRQLKAEDGTTISYVDVPPLNEAEPTALLLAFPANAQNAEDFAALLSYVADETLHIAVPYYRGYGPSGGKPNEDNVVADAVTLYRHLYACEPGLPVYVVGWSIGTGIAVQVAAQCWVDQLILLTPFESVAARAQEKFPYLPVHLLCLNRFENLKYAPRVRAPTHIIRAEHDTTVPPHSTDKLADALPNLYTDSIVSGCGHRTVINQGETLQLLASMLNRPKKRTAF